MEAANQFAARTAGWDKAAMDNTVKSAGAAVPREIPRWVKYGYTAFMAVLIPVYWWHYGPTNFLYFCDVALLLTLVGVWVGMCGCGVRAGSSGRCSDGL
jgi:hypothetical protein